ncbi:MAG: GxxExxY protein [bacterium]
MREEYQENLLAEIIIQCIIKVHQTLGPGFLESIYRFKSCRCKGGYSCKLC